MLRCILRGLQILCTELKGSRLDGSEYYYIILPGTALYLNSATAYADNGV